MCNLTFFFKKKLHRACLLKTGIFPIHICLSSEKERKRIVWRAAQSGGSYCTPLPLIFLVSPQNQSQRGFPSLILTIQHRLLPGDQSSPSPMPRLLLADSSHPGPGIWIFLLPARRNLQDSQENDPCNCIANSYFKDKPGSANE